MGQPGQRALRTLLAAGDGDDVWRRDALQKRGGLAGLHHDHQLAVSGVSIRDMTGSDKCSACQGDQMG
jgi:hypothetical protein